MREGVCLDKRTRLRVLRRTLPIDVQSYQICVAFLSFILFKSIK